MVSTLRSGIHLDELSEEIRPQDDLYRHVNGAWIDRTEIPDDKSRWGSFVELREQAQEHVKAIIEEATGAEPGTEMRKIGDLFTSFMDTERIAQLDTRPIDGPLADVDAIFDIPAFLTTVGTLEREGIGGPIGAYIEPDPGTPTRYVLFLLQSGLSLPDESYYRVEDFADKVTALRDYAEKMLTLVGLPDAAAQAERIVALETELASHHWDNVKSRDAVATYNLMSWVEFVELAGVDLAPWRDAIAPNHTDHFAEVNVYQPSFFTGLGTLLTVDRLEDWKAWLRLQIIRAAAPYLTDDFVDANFAFYGTELSGTPTIRERWKRGADVVEGALGEAVGKVYVERHFPPRAKTEMDTLVANLIEAYRQSITSLDWMTDETRARALEKLDAFTPKIGYPDEWKDYSTLEISADDLFGNVRRAAEWEHERQLDKLGGPIDRFEWHMTPQTVNAYYHPLMNEIVFPAAILQEPFFDMERDAAANYGGIGAVIGHEIGHGFDDQGSAFDGTGALNDWWTDTDRAAFEQRTSSLIAQYDALTPVGLDPKHHVNGALTIGENIGDLGGLGIALKAYALSLDGAEAPVLDGYTGVQRLFLSWGQVWQSKSREAETIRLLAIDPHSPSEFRCNQIVRNVDAFYDAFTVTESDELWLAPEERVTIW